MSSISKITKFSSLQVMIYCLVIMFAFLFAAPFLWMILTSIKPDSELYFWPISILPKKITLEHYKYVIFSLSQFNRFFLNSVVVTVTTVIIILAASGLGGYAFGCKKFLGKELLFTGILFFLMIPYIIYLIPVFLIEHWMGINNSWLALILPYVALNLPWGLLIMRGAFETIPKGIMDSARIDGCNEFQLWYRILLPLTKPGLAATAIISFVFVWQEYLFATSLIKDSKWLTLPAGVVYIKDELQTLIYGRIGAMTILSLIPISVVFLAFKNFFIKGLREGMLKG